jgi:hypothetical protein
LVVHGVDVLAGAPVGPAAGVGVGPAIAGDLPGVRAYVLGLAGIGPEPRRVPGSDHGGRATSAVRHFAGG